MGHHTRKGDYNEDGSRNVRAVETDNAPVEEVVETVAEGLEALSYAELRTLADVEGAKATYRMTKKALIAAIRDAVE